MDKQIETYKDIKNWKESEIRNHISDTVSLNSFHDEVMKAVFSLAVKKMNKEPPCRFSWFITGSGGRREQGLISDQDHGIIYEIENSECAGYFSSLGEKLADGLNISGYPYCDGNVMASNPLWTKSIAKWEEQLAYWLKEESWATIRSLQIFYDGRSLIGEEEYIHHLKCYIHQSIQHNPNLLKRLLENVRHIKNSIGPLGQILTEETGTYKGSINLKYTAFIPYVNGVRLLALKEGIEDTSTNGRMEALIMKSPYNEDLHKYIESFKQLLTYRLLLMNDVESYDDAHHLFIKNLNKERKNEIKKILKNGKRLHQYVANLIEQGVKSWL